MTRPSYELLEFLSRNPVPWMWWDEQKQKLIIVADNHLLSTHRACPQHFVNAHVWGLHRKGVNVAGVQRNWYLDFGICVHSVLEDYYRHFRESNFDALAFMTAQACVVWAEKDMQVHAEHKEFKLIGGLPGFTGLLVQYALVLSAQNEKLRVLGTEIGFGKNLEVPLLIAENYEYYLAGRMDLIVDDGYFICPMDHKTMGTFRGDPGLRFENDEGPTGYIYALKTVLPQYIPEGEILKRDCTKILMNLICKTPAALPVDRFKRIAIRKTAEQLEAYRRRMITSCGRLLADMETLASGWNVVRNTQVCQNWVHFPCTYFDVCRQQSSEAELVTINNGFTKAALWDTETVQN